MKRCKEEHVISINPLSIKSRWRRRIDITLQGKECMKSLLLSFAVADIFMFHLVLMSSSKRGGGSNWKKANLVLQKVLDRLLNSNSLNVCSHTVNIFLSWLNFEIRSALYFQAKHIFGLTL